MLGTKEPCPTYETQREISLEKNERLIGRSVSTLIEGGASEEGYALKGRASTQAPDVDGCVYIRKGVAKSGEIRDVVITGAEDYDLIGEIRGQGGPFTD